MHTALTPSAKTTARPNARPLARWGAVALVATFTVGTAAACGGRGHGWMTPERTKKYMSYRIDDRLDDVNATEAQKKQVKAILLGLYDEGQLERDEGRVTARELVAEWKKEEPSEEAMGSLIDVRATAMTDFAHRAKKASLKIHGILDADQRAALADDLDEWMSRREGRRH